MIPGITASRIRSAAGGDPFYSNVALLLHFDGAPGSQTILDNSPSPISPNSLGSGFELAASPSIFGQSGAFLEVASPVLYPPDSRFYPNSDYTWEIGFSPNSFTTSQVLFLYGETSAVGNSQLCYFLQFEGNTTGKTLRFGFFSGDTLFELRSSIGLTEARFYRIAVTRDGATWRMFIDGAQVAALSSAAVLNSTAGMRLTLGAYVTATPLPANGWFDELRKTKGVARYTSAYSVLPTPFPNGA